MDYEGDIYYMDKKINHNDKNFFSKKVSYLPQFSANDSTLTVFEAVMLGLMNTLSIRVNQSQIHKVNEMLKAFDLDQLARQQICELSGGQLQMVLLAQAIIKQPDILLLDEPLNNLDIHHQLSLLKLISQLSKNNNIITLLILHDINLAARYADDIVIMNEGKIFSQGKPAKVITKEMLKSVYKIECNVNLTSQNFPIIEFIDIAKECQTGTINSDKERYEAA
jgi:iron complex transport system ATP-binding protein